jgi:hypothetical protein
MPQSKSKYGIYDEKERRARSLDTSQLPLAATKIAEVVFEWLCKQKTDVPYDITLPDLAALLQRTHDVAVSSWRYTEDDNGYVVEPRLTTIIALGNPDGTSKLYCGEEGPFRDAYRALLTRFKLDLINDQLIKQKLMPPNMMLKAMARNTTIDPVTKKKSPVYDGWVKIQYMQRPSFVAPVLPAPKPKRSAPPRASPPRASPPPCQNPFDLLDEPAPSSPTSSPAPSAPSTPTPTSTVPPTIAAAAAYWAELASKRSPE